MREKSTLLRFAVVIVLLVGGVGRGAEIVVDPNGGYDHTTIGAAIAAAGTGDIVIVRPGRYRENINMAGKAMTLRSTDPTDPGVVTSTIIDGRDANSVIICVSGEDANTVISGFMITNGSGRGINYGEDHGGGMYNESSSPTVSNCTFIGNRTGVYGDGGGMYNTSSSPTVTNCTFIGNGAYGSAGGMFNTSSSPTVTNCTFISNVAGTYGYGGGMCNATSSPTVTNCTFTNNAAVGSIGRGGGMYNYESSPTVSDCTFSRNRAGQGGGMYNYSSSPIVTDSYFCLSLPVAIGGDPLDGDSSGNNFEFCPPPRAVVEDDDVEGDVDGDGDIDFEDFAKMAGNWLAGTGVN